MSIAELTLDNGKKLGIPKHSALIIAKLNKIEGKPDAKTLLRYSLGMGQVRVVYVKDSYKHILGLFPAAKNGQSWAHVTDSEGQDLALPKGSVVEYEEEEDGAYRITADLEGGAVMLKIKATHEEVRAITAGDGPSPTE